MRSSHPPSVAATCLAALDVLESADQRIELIGRVHRQLYDPASSGLPLPEQIENVVAQAKDVAWDYAKRYAAPG